MGIKVPLPTAVLLGALAVYFGSSAFALKCENMGCDFENDLCQWTNSSGGGYSLRWRRGAGVFGNYAHLNVYRQPSGSKGRLSSPWLDSQPGHTCQLWFKYYMGGSGTSGCRLSVLRETKTEGTITTVWSTRQPGVSSVSFSDWKNASVDCQNGPQYRIHFIGERLNDTAYACGIFPEIDIDDTSCTATVITTTTTTTTTTKTTTTTSENSPTTPDSIHHPTTTSGKVTPAPLNSDDGPSTGAIAGIVVAVIIVIAIAIVVVFVLRRRKQNDKPTSPASPDYVNTRPRAEGIPGGRANPAYELDSSVTSGVNGNASNYSEANYESTASGGYELASTRQPARGEYHSSSPDPYSHLSRGGARNGPGVDDTYDHTQTAGAANGENAYCLAKVPREKDLARKPRTAANNYTNVEAPDGDDYNHLGDPIPDPTTTSTTEYSVAKPLPSHIASGEAAAIYEVAGTTDYEAVDEGGNLMTSRSASSGKPMTSPSGPSDDYYSGLDLKGEKKAKQGDLGYLHNYDHARDPAALNADDYNVLDVDDSRSREQQRNVAADDYSHV